MSIYAMQETEYTDLLEMLLAHKEEQQRLLEVQQREIEMYKQSLEFDKMYE